VGLARFAFTPILPVMESQTSMTSGTATACATSNYVGYLVGALGGLRLRPTRPATNGAIVRGAAVVACLSLAAMPVVDQAPVWVVLPFLAGVSGALLFLVATDDLLSGGQVVAAGWGFGGVGAGVVISGVVVSAMAADWQRAWWGSAAAAGILTALAWRRPVVGPSRPAQASPWKRRDRRPHSFMLVWWIYTLEGMGYIIAGTFLVAAVSDRAPGPLGSNVWIAVGRFAIPSCAGWTWVATRVQPATVLCIALAVQTVGVVLATFGSWVAAMTSGVLFGATIIAVPWLAVGLGRSSGRRQDGALMTVGYSVGQVLGPIAVRPLQTHGYQLSLAASACVLGLAAMLAGALAIWTARHPVSVDARV
jgi:hypothetical protein